MTDPSRFTRAQDLVIDRVLAELEEGQKRTHWMWIIFPQLRSLGRSPTAQHYGIADLDEARAYLANPVLRQRLETSAATLLQHSDKSAEEILGPVDAMKLRSCATLFARAGGASVFTDILASFFDGQPCARTLTDLDGV